MDKNNWTYKKFADVFDLQMGKTPSRDNSSYWGGQNTWVSIADLQHKYIDSSKENITDIAVSESNIKKVRKGTVIMSFKLTVGRCAIAAKDLFTNEAIMAFTPLHQDILSSEYIYYYLKGYRWIGANKAVMGKTLNKKSISSNIFAYPPLAEQERIVAELDLLSSIIDKKKAQLKELDQLAQSIFYDMFGDPITNEKGWDYNELSDLYKFIDYRGKTPNKTTGGIPLITAKNIRKGAIDYNVKEYISELEHRNRLTRGIPRMGDLLFTTEAPLGNAAIANLDIYATAQRLIVLQKKENVLLHNIYVLYYILSDKFQDELLKQATGSTIKGIKGSKLEKMSIPLPPLPLQQEFASKIEAIERQKSLIQQSIAETQTLFDSRMDYWFG